MNHNRVVLSGKIIGKFKLPYMNINAFELNVDGVYGTTTMHIMHDDCGNEYVWTTGAKSLTVEEEYFMRATIKDHRVYKGINQTILTRCSIAK